MPSASELRETAQKPLNPSVPQTYEIRERQQQEQPANSKSRPSNATNAPLNEDYEPNPSASIQLSPERQHIVDSIVRLYSGSGTNDEGSTGAKDMMVYAKKSVYDDILSCEFSIQKSILLRFVYLIDQKLTHNLPNPSRLRHKVQDRRPMVGHSCCNEKQHDQIPRSRLFDASLSRGQHSSRDCLQDETSLDPKAVAQDVRRQSLRHSES
jgi:hypothetical protein